MGLLATALYSLFKPIITIAGLARRVELGELIDARFEFVSNRHL
jgi:hypothetical protein